jgi:TPR repeat protein
MRIPGIYPPAKFSRIVLCASLAGLAACASTDKAEMTSDLERIAQSGDVDARYQLGTQYADGAPPNAPQAIYWLCLAAREGHVSAQMRLARLYEDQPGSGGGGAGSGKLSNPGSAYFWYTAAASQGDDQAFARREALEARMDESEVAEVKRRATRWQQAGCLEPA